MNKLFSCLVAFCALYVATNVYAQSAEQASPEEVAVRTAYDHASYAVELGTVNQYVLQSKQINVSETLDDRLARNGLEFKLSDFENEDIHKAGDLSSFVLQPAQVGQSVIRLDSYPVAAAEGRYLTLYESEAMARWSDELSVRGSVPYTLRDAALTWVRTIETFSVTVTLGNNTKTYRAFALFGPSDRLIADPVFPGVNDFLGTSQFSLHPELLVRSAAYDSMAGRAYLKRTVGCTAYHCGASEGEIGRRLKAPLNTTAPATR